MKTRPTERSKSNGVWRPRSCLLSAVIGWTAYPAILATAVGTALGMIARGFPLGLTAITSFLVALFATWALERFSPHEQAWNPSLREASPDGVYLLLASAAQPAARVLGQLFGVLGALALRSWLGPKPWPPGLPLWAQLILAVLLADLGKYWLHRLSHEHPWLWRFHALHHAPTRMYSLNGVRLHPVNMLWNLTLDMALPLFLGLEGPAIVLVGSFRSAVSILQHGNIEMRLGWLSWVLSTPELHRWHHSSLLGESKANYGSTLIVWDMLFGTRHLPRARRAPARLGLSAGGIEPSNVGHQLVWPWCESRAATCRLLRGWRPNEAGAGDSAKPG